MDQIERDVKRTDPFTMELYQIVYWNIQEQAFSLFLSLSFQIQNLRLFFCNVLVDEIVSKKKKEKRKMKEREKTDLSK